MLDVGCLEENRAERRGDREPDQQHAEDPEQRGVLEAVV